MLERDIESALGKRVRAKGGLYYKFVSPGKVGVPDRIIVLPDGRLFFVEIKKQGGKLSPIQKYEIEELRKRSQRVEVIVGVAGVEDFCQKYGIEK